MPEQDANTKRLGIGIALIAVIYLIAVPFYMHFEGLGIIDAIYFTSTTITTVGYGDIAPKTNEGKLFTVFVLFSGVSVFFYHVTHFGLFRERTIDPHVQRRLEVLRNLTALQTGSVKSEEVKRIKEKMRGRADADKNQGFGRL
ncbi:MAG: potassium channel family protein [Candidatus Micrarchaeota archaeon]